MKLSINISSTSSLFVFVQKAKRRQSSFQDLWKYFAEEEQGELLFYGRNKKAIIKQLENALGKQKNEQFKKTLSAANALFAPQWKETERHLQAWKKYFKKNKKLLQKTLANIEKISGSKKFDYQSAMIQLVSVPGGSAQDLGAWFSWTPKESFIVVEIPIELRAPNNYFPLGIVIHEFFHLILRKNKKLFSEMIREAKKNKKLLIEKAKGMPHAMFLEELLVSSFIPEGYISERFLNISIRRKIDKEPDDLLDWRRYIAAAMHETAKEYSDSQKKVDKTYLKKIIKKIKNPLSAV